jgi:hypothetical protein
MWVGWGRKGDLLCGFVRIFYIPCKWNNEKLNNYINLRNKVENGTSYKNWLENSSHNLKSTTTILISHTPKMLVNKK